MKIHVKERIILTDLSLCTANMQTSVVSFPEKPFNTILKSGTPLPVWKINAWRKYN